MMQPESLPNLQLVPLAACVLHESVDPQRVARLAARIATDNSVRNPPIVARHAASSRLMVLDGATRITALRELGFAAAPVQIVNYADARIELHTWAHLIHAVDLRALLRALRALDGLQVRSAAEGASHAERSICALLADDGQQWLLEGGATLLDEARLLEAVFRCYVQRGTVQRLPHDEHFNAAQLPTGTVAAIFPRYTKADLWALTTGGGILPAGITRHVIPGRVLRLNVPLAALRAGSFAQQEAWFAAWVAERVAAGRARLYNEPTWLFDE